MATVAQRSFAAGEIAPAIYPRVDTVKYQTGLRTLRNMYVKKHGGATNRPGTSYVCEVKSSSNVARLIPYKYTDALTSVIELGNQSLRFVNQGTQIRATAQAITAITSANPAVITYTGADTYANGDEVYITGIVGAIGNYLNGRTFLVASVNTVTNTFAITYLSGTNVNSTAMGAYSSGGTVAEVVQLASSAYPAASAAFEVRYSQNNSKLSICHQTTKIIEILASSLTSWTANQADLNPAIPLGPNTVLGTAGAGGTKTFRYQVTAVDANFEESLANTHEKSFTISGATAANPCVVTTSAAHGYEAGDTVFFEGLDMTTVLVVGWKTVGTVGSATTFEVAGTNTTGGTFFTGREVYRDYITIHSAAEGTAAAACVLTWSTVTGAVEYNIYKEKQGLYGFHGSTTNLTYRDEGGNGDVLENPPKNRTGLHDTVTPDTDTYPLVVGSIQQRRAFGRTNDEIQTLWLSKTALPNNFTVHFPVADDDSIKLTFAGSQNVLRHVLDLGSIVVLTQGGEWVLQGDAGGVLTPTQINPKQVGYNGASIVPPVVINNNALYVQARGNIVRDLAFDFSVDGYKGNDLTIFSSHLFEGYTIVDWAYQQAPNSIVWAVRSDGKVLGLTYIREQDIWAWHRHDFTGGTVESVCSVPEGEEDAVYFLVKRTIGGATKRYIERLNTRVIDDVVDSIFMDSSKTFDGRHTGVVTMTLSGGTTWTYEETMTLTASASTFTSADVGKAVHITAADGTLIRFTITGYTGVTIVTGKPNRTVPVSMRSIAVGNSSGSWAMAITQLTGLWHLEGQSVSVFADGFVVASPNNPSYTAYTVTNGIITLARPYAVIHVGLPITADIETLDLDTVQGETMADKKKLITEYTVWLEESRGLYAGAKPPTDDDVDPIEGLYETKLRDDETQDEPPALFTGKKTDMIRGEWNSNGRVFLRQLDPVPLSVLAIAPGGMIPFRAGG